jgi:hypothetical protein
MFNFEYESTVLFAQDKTAAMIFPAHSDGAAFCLMDEFAVPINGIRI